MTPPDAPGLRSRLRRLFQADEATAALGATVLTAESEALTLRFEVARRHTNAHGICHGGVIFFLADAAAGLFANARAAEGEQWVTHTSSAEFLAPARDMDVLDAQCALDSDDGGRRAVFTTVVRRGDDVIAQVACHMVRTRAAGRSHAS